MVVPTGAMKNGLCCRTCYAWGRHKIDSRPIQVHNNINRQGNKAGSTIAFSLDGGIIALDAGDINLFSTGTGTGTCVRILRGNTSGIHPLVFFFACQSQQCKDWNTNTQLDRGLIQNLSPH